MKLFKTKIYFKVKGVDGLQFISKGIDAETAYEAEEKVKDYYEKNCTKLPGVKSKFFLEYLYVEAQN